MINDEEKFPSSCTKNLLNQTLLLTLKTKPEEKILKKMEKNKISQQTTNPTISTKERGWYFIDLENKVLGRSAVEISRILRGKNNSHFNYNFDLGNHVVVVNAKKALLTGKKRQGKKYYDHSGYPGGLRERSAGVMIDSYPVELVHRVIKGLMPHNRLSKKQLTRLFVYSGPDHPHLAQQSGFLPVNQGQN